VIGEDTPGLGMIRFQFHGPAQGRNGLVTTTRGGERQAVFKMRNGGPGLRSDQRPEELERC
jgi:hypothetical protein